MNRFVPVLATVLFGVAAVAAAPRPGYLNVIGPSALRFREAPAVQKSSLPPLPKDEPTAGFLISTSVPTAQVALSATGPATSTTETVGPDTNEVFVTPQMLVDFFHNRNTGSGHSTTVVVPFGFVPPDGSAKPSSSATYHSP
jgi:hypothetical protein